RDRKPYRSNRRYWSCLCDPGTARRERPGAVSVVGSRAGARRPREEAFHSHAIRNAHAPPFDVDAGTDDGRPVARPEGRPLVRPSPPRLLQVLLRVLPVGDDRKFLADDLDEEFQVTAASAGVRAARRWYWQQIWLSAPPLVARRAATFGASLMTLLAARQREPRTLMLANVTADLRYAWRTSRRAPVLTISVVLAIALGIAA